MSVLTQNNYQVFPVPIFFFFFFFFLSFFSPTADPEITERQYTPDDEFVVLACDGIWDVLSSQQVVDIVRSKIAKGMPYDQICEFVSFFLASLSSRVHVQLTPPCLLVIDGFEMSRL